MSHASYCGSANVSFVDRFRIKLEYADSLLRFVVLHASVIRCILKHSPCEYTEYLTGQL